MTQVLEMQLPLDNFPKICVIPINEKHYLNFYDLDNLCTCGNDEWYDSLLSIDFIGGNACLPPRKIHRCKNCKSMRLARIKNKFENIIFHSDCILKSFIKHKEKFHHDDHDLLFILKNAAAKLELNMIENQKTIN